uniref:Bifunctional dihydrofolate reductase-thymidylate synthase n=1 Tax=Eucampia antarctica TaxID=49252 RepID=A0A7S2S702_9STRA|mmetsp:Transcript_3188/g.3048  ORF Transcript_3188/g.3048 Transcript_3188/m.3048 type:complete len:510 (+) Transcript_3188:110-1639(+)|eukprot:CAMPEP_0197835478 /NCGR_PEP_ID=MMETSP1437-20131217/25852_1 /TAXON_ID=49252 ORGANISM="Eucampia antarctica, Strain CCMP1452" /NCGR_SAMPLE_ID=MMETSP1437 /ASSEMBLY_ACC=CAM_ASM_001096 /LENGTH=509 /DNA_ID=CAMNT_0043440937 /DNA_START=110 /DNA_END=1639 /DNA_ORIENTATION=-
MVDAAAIVAAATTSRGIGIGGKLPWRLSDDMAHFKHVTCTPPNIGQTNAVIMGRKTWDSIPAKFRPLDNRTNVILTRDPSKVTLPESAEHILVVTSLEEATEKLAALNSLGDIFVIGGGEVYNKAIETGLVKRVIYTEVLDVPDDSNFDTFFPNLSSDDWDCKTFEKTEKTGVKKGDDEVIYKDAKSGLQYKLLDFRRKVVDEQYSAKSQQASKEDTQSNLEEMQYLDMCRDIIQNGVQRGDRTGTGTLSKFGTQMRFSLRDGTLPLLTTKRVFWRGVAEELLWFVKGSTNSNELAAKDIHIWDGNGSREFLDSRGLNHRDAGDLGPVYGFQWRHFGAKYVDMATDYSGQGFDQLADCIDKIKNNPEDRRIIMSAWNPADLEEMALPPCHMFCQFYVDTKKNELSCQMYQRSADMGLGVPFNIASYALLTHMIAQATGRKPGDFIHTIGDAHVYLNHVDALKEQLERSPRVFPKLKINPERKNVDEFLFEDFEVDGYNPYKNIKMKMAV